MFVVRLQNVALSRCSTFLLLTWQLSPVKLQCYRVLSIISTNTRSARKLSWPRLYYDNLRYWSVISLAKITLLTAELSTTATVLGGGGREGRGLPEESIDLLRRNMLSIFRYHIGQWKYAWVVMTLQSEMAYLQSYGDNVCIQTVERCN